MTQENKSKHGSTPLLSIYFHFFCKMFKRMILKRLHLQEKAESMRPRGSARQTSIEKRYAYLQNTTPKKQMSEKKRTKLLHRIEKIANWLDNAVPHSPIPLGLDSLLVGCVQTRYHC